MEQWGIFLLSTSSTSSLISMEEEEECRRLLRDRPIDRPTDKVCVHCTVQRYVLGGLKGVHYYCTLCERQSEQGQGRAGQGRAKQKGAHVIRLIKFFYFCVRFPFSFRLPSLPPSPSFNSAAAAAAGRSWQFDMHKSRVVVKVESIIPSSSLFCLFVHVTLLHTHTHTHVCKIGEKGKCRLVHVVCVNDSSQATSDAFRFWSRCIIRAAAVEQEEERKEKREHDGICTAALVVVADKQRSLSLKGVTTSRRRERERKTLPTVSKGL